MFLLHPDIFLWDFAILLLIALFGSIFVLSFVRFRRTRSVIAQFFIGFLGLAGFVGFLLVTYGSFIEPQMIVTDRFSVSLAVQQPLKIVAISDIHAGPYSGKRFLKRVVDRINRELPDLVLIAGDTISHGEFDARSLEPLKDIRAGLGTFAVLGNHDLGQFATIIREERYRGRNVSTELVEAFDDLGIKLLRNEHRILQVQGQAIAIAGVDDPWSGQDDLESALGDIPGDIPLILLAHSPNIILKPLSRRAHLIVAGHTHGGQIRLPFIGPIPPIPSGLPRTYDQGIFADGKTTLAITRGIGETNARARLFAWPEIMVIETDRRSL